MHNPEKKCKLIKFSPLKQMPELEAEFLEQYFEVIAVNYTDDGLEEYVGYAPADFDLADFKQASAHLQLPVFTIEELASKNWLKENVIKFAPFEIGRFLIYGIHETSCPCTNKIPVQVYAATAFGSEHQTTKMCLTAISELADMLSKAPKRILDMGTGSGILSIAAAKIWSLSPQITAADIDAESVDVTRSNAITNSVEPNLTVLLSDGYNNPAITAAAPYDIILANILANPLKAMAASAYNNLAANGYYLISGFIESQEKELITHHQDIGFKLIKTYQMENWRAALLQK